MTTGTITRLSLSTIIKPSDANSQFNIIRYEIIISKKNTIKLKSLPPVLKMTHGGGLYGKRDFFSSFLSDYFAERKKNANFARKYYLYLINT